MAPDFRPYRVTALYRVQQALGATWVEDGGWRLPGTFSDPESEARGVSEGVGLLDESPIGKLDLKGAHAPELLARAGAAVPVGRSGALSLGPTLPGLRCLRLAPAHFLILTPRGRPPDVEAALAPLLAEGSRCAHLTDVTSALSVLALVGPRAREVLEKLMALDLRPRAFPDGACTEGGLAKVHAVVHREDWGQLPAYHLLVAREHGEYGWEVIRAAGASQGLVPFGLGAERRLREELDACGSS